MNAFLNSSGGSFPPLLRHLCRTSTSSTTVALRQLLLPLPLLSGQQITSGPFSFADLKELTTWTLLPSTGFRAAKAAAADAMRRKARFRPMKLRHTRRLRLLPSAQVPLPTDMIPASSSPAVPFAAAAMDMDLIYYSGKKSRKAQVLSKAPEAQSSGSSRSFPHHRYHFRHPRRSGMSRNPFFPPGEFGRNRGVRTAQPQSPPPPAHRSPRDISDRAPIPGHSDVAWFRVTDTTRLGISQGDITTWSIDGETDAIVNAANQRMLGGGGVDGAIHRRAGPRLREACEKIRPIEGVRCPIGKAKVTDGFDLPASRVIHTVGPRYGLDSNPAELLRDSYLSSLDVALTAGIKFIAFPAISCGVYGYPLDEAAEVSLDAIKGAPEFFSEIHFIHFEKKTYEEWMKVAERDFTPM